VRGLGRVEDGLDGLLFGRVDETARVDDDDIGVVGRRRVVPGCPQTGLECVGIGLVLGAAEGADEERAARAVPQR